MALDPKAEAALALHRFGLGPRAGSIAAIASDPRGALIAELDRAGAGRIGTADDVAQAIVALAALDWVTGQVVAADGGVMLRSPIDPVESMPEGRR